MKVLAWILVVVGTYLVVLNYHALATNSANRRRGIDRHHSFIPLLGGVLVAVGTYLLLDHRLAFGIAVVDPGVWSLALLPAALFRGKWR